MKTSLCRTRMGKRFTTLTPELTKTFSWQNSVLLLLLKYRMTGKVQSKLQRTAVILPSSTAHRIRRPARLKLQSDYCKSIPN